ncbi:MAG: rod shape-determining protein RodA [Bacteroidota bacterium]
MSRRNISGLSNLDWMTFSLYLSLVGVGWLMIYTVGYDDQRTLGAMVFDLNTNVGKQTLWIGVSFLLMLFILFIDWNFWRTFAYLIYAATLLALLLVLFIGIKVKGANSWFSVFGFTLQPSEFAKFGTCLALAAYLSSYGTDLKNFKSQITCFGLFLLPMALILLQPDAGSALVFLSFLVVLYREGFSVNFFILGFSVITVFVLGLVFNPMFIIIGMIQLSILGLITYQKNKLYWLGGFIVFAGLSYFAITKDYLSYVLLANFVGLLAFIFIQWKERRQHLIRPIFTLIIIGSLFSVMANYTFNNILQSHQQDRINVWLRPSLCDPQGSLYNVLQSKMAIGSGGLQGKGFLQGTMTKLNYVPEQVTDFIFCTVGEEQGFIGTLGIVGLFFLLLLRITVIAERQRSDFSRHYAYGLAGILFLHFFVNIGMTMGLVPIIGIPLPFISYGGSSIFGFTIMIAVLLSLDRNRLTST